MHKSSVWFISAIIFLYNINIVHARSRAPAWSCLFATKITGRKFVTTFHGTYNFKSSIKKFYNSIMLRSDLVIAGSNFIFSHINDNYSKFLDPKKKFLVIFRGINTDYFDSSTTLESDEDNLLKKWEINRGKKLILMPGRLTSWKGQELFIEAINLVNKELGHEAFYAVILGSDQGRKIYKKKDSRFIIIMEKWEEIVGKEYYKKSNPLKITKDQVLKVEVSIDILLDFINFI